MQKNAKNFMEIFLRQILKLNLAIFSAFGIETVKFFLLGF